MLHREAWNRRGRAHSPHTDDALQRTGMAAAATTQNLDNVNEQPPSEHPSMPELYTDLVDIPEEENEEEEVDEEDEEPDDADDDDQPPHHERSLQPY